MAVNQDHSSPFEMCGQPSPCSCLCPNPSRRPNPKFELNLVLTPCRCWAFSIYPEAVAILPQLFMLQKQGGAESLTSHYVMLLGLYRLFYLFNWIYRSP